MNDFHLLNLANATISERRAEADRQRLAHAANSAGGPVRTASEAPQHSLLRPHPRLGSLFTRLALFARLALR